MGVPQDIRAVPRPRNTIVEDSGSDGIYRYSVRERKGVDCESGKNPRPRNGRVIGHIINFKYVPVSDKLASGGPAALSFGSSAFVHSMSSDILDDLLACFEARDAFKIIALASLRAIKPGIAASRYRTEYERTFISVFYPGVALSRNTVCIFLQDLGKDRNKRQAFIARRIASVCETDHIAIDGTLKQDTSSVNSFSAFSYKGRVRGVRDFSIIYAYSIEKKEPLCAEVFPGNCIDASAFKEFIRHNNLSKGLILADKGFPVSQIKDELKIRPDLHFLSPLKRSDSGIKAHDMLSFNSAFVSGNSKILCRKLPVEDGRFLYSFQDACPEYLEKAGSIEHGVNRHDFEIDKFNLKKSSSGVIVFESDQDLSCEEIYRCYSERWELETMFDMYRHDEDLTVTAVQNDFSVRGSEFIDLISTIITVIAHQIS